MATKLYLLSTNATGVVPNAKQSGDTITDDFATSRATYSVPAAMDTAAGSNNVSNSGTGTNYSSQHYSHYGTWVSPLINGSQNISGTVTIGLVMAETNTKQNNNPRVKIYRWKADDTYGSDLLESTSGTEVTTSYPSTPTTYFSAVSITATDFSDGDRIVIEINDYNTVAPNDNANRVHGIQFGGADNGAYGSYVSFSQTISFKYQTVLTSSLDYSVYSTHNIQQDLSYEVYGNTHMVYGHNVTRTFTASTVWVGQGTTVTYLIVGGGGQGGCYVGGGGGAGGVLTGTIAVNAGESYDIVVGNGGSGASSGAGNSGGDSSFHGLTAYGGGGGACYNTAVAKSGGSGGGGTGGSAPYRTGGSGTGGQGNSGGSSVSVAAGGGGGAGEAGHDATWYDPNYNGANGGDGVYVAAFAATYGGGGGGGYYSSYTGGQGGTGGGGACNTAGTDGLGGGGGGYGAVSGSGPGAAGGKGIVKLKYNDTVYLKYAIAHRIAKTLTFNVIRVIRVKTSFGTTSETFQTDTMWYAPATTSVEVLVVGGGGGGGYYVGGGGGAGGCRLANAQVSPGQGILITIGSGGSGGTAGSPRGGLGGDSAFGSFVSTGGGGGGSYDTVAPTWGGSGGGGSGSYSTGADSYPVTNPVQGYKGGNTQGTASGGGGGGGAGAAGSDCSGYTGGKGGDGLSSDISGTLTWYAGGGGGGGYSTSGYGAGGQGGGGNGSGTDPARNGTDYLGGGGGGSYNAGTAGHGGKGVVIVRYNLAEIVMSYRIKNTHTNILDLHYHISPVLRKFLTFVISPKPIIRVSTYDYDTYATPGTYDWYVPNNVFQIDVLVVGGGGAGGGYVGGGGGAGGYRTTSLSVTPGQKFTLTVGSGGTAGANPANNGGNSSFDTLVSTGGGGGGYYNSTPGQNGGSGGGGSGNQGRGNASPVTDPAQGCNGGYGYHYPDWGIGGSGGGGASQPGQDCPGGYYPGAGGCGKQWLNGQWYAGGGAGGSYDSAGGNVGGYGGGGKSNFGAGDSGVNGTGGGGAGSYSNYGAGSGGHGTVIIRYLGQPKLMYDIISPTSHRIRPSLKYKVYTVDHVITKNLSYVPGTIKYTLQLPLKFYKKVEQIPIQRTMKYNVYKPSTNTYLLYKYLSYKITFMRKDLTYFVLPGPLPYRTWTKDTITITNPVDVDNYQHKLVVTWRPGINNDFSDLRFTQLNGYPCYYAIHSKTDGSTCEVWIKTPQANQTGLYMYHCGDTTQTSMSDPFNTFLTYDHFDGASVDTNLWSTDTYNTTISTSNSIVTIAAGDNGAVGYVRSYRTLFSNIPVTVEYSASLYNSESTTWSQVMVGCPATINGKIHDIYHDAIPIDSGNGFVYTIWGGVTYPATIITNGMSTAITAPTVDTYCLYKVNNYGTNNTTATFYRDGIYQGSGSQTFSQAVEFAAGNGSVGAYASYLKVDWVRARRYVATEPTLSITSKGYGLNRVLQYRIYAKPKITKTLSYVLGTIKMTKNLSYTIPHLAIQAQPPTVGRVPFPITFKITTHTPASTIWNQVWDYDGAIGTETAVDSLTRVKEFTAYGEYDITLTASTGNCTVVAPYHLSLTAPLLPKAEFCMYRHIEAFPEVVDFFNYSVDATSYHWYFGDGGESTETNPSHTYTSAGRRYVTLHANNSNGEDIITHYVDITYADPLRADFEVASIPEGGIGFTVAVTLTVTDASGNKNSITKQVQVATGPFTKFKDLSTGNIIGWEWDFGNGDT